MPIAYISGESHCAHCGTPADDGICIDCFDERSDLWANYHYFGGPDPDTLPCPVPVCEGKIHADRSTP